MKAKLDLLRVLVRLFFSRFFDRESLSPQGEAERSVVQVLGFLAAPGAFVALLFCVLPLSTTGWNLVALRCLFLTFSMMALSFIVVLEWDALFLDHRDYQVLRPLPVPSWILFLAKAMALSLFLGLFLADINFFSSLFWPGVDDGNPFAVIAVHSLVVATAGIFSALAAASMQGLLLTLLPGRIWRPVVTCIQTIMIAVLVMLLFVSPIVASGLQTLIGQGNDLVRYVPAFWFAGFYERLRPATRNRSLTGLGRMAMPAVGCALAIFLASYLPWYRRHARKLIESAPHNRSGPGRVHRAISAGIDSALLNGPIQRAVYHFMGQTITRSMKHRLFLATYAGFGAALVVMHWASGPAGLLQVPLTLSFVLISGLRAAFNFPAEPGANWAFRISDSDGSRDCLTAMRKWIAMCAIAPLFLALVPVELLFFPWHTVLSQILFGVTLSMILTEVMFLGFRKIPFTCLHFPGKTNLVLLIVIYVAGFSLYSSTMASLEAWLMTRPAAAAAFFGAAAGVWFALWRRADQAASGLEYQDEGDPEVQCLGLTAS